MTLGKPLDLSVLPRGVYVTEDPELRTITLTEHRQLFLPVGTLRCALEIQQNPEGEVTSVQLEEYHVSYWVLLIAGWSGKRERYLDESGQVHERTLQRPRLGVRTPVENLPVFIMGMGQCFGCDAWALRKQRKRAAQAVASPTQPPDP